jgi:hypothetical protein
VGTRLSPGGTTEFSHTPSANEKAARRGHDFHLKYLFLKYLDGNSPQNSTGN